MRRFFTYVIPALLILSCNSEASKPGTVTTENSIINYEIPKPEILTDDQIATYQQKLNVLFDTALLNKNFNGGIIVAKGGNILYEKYTGFKNPLQKNEAITDSTSFHLASTSKPFTGMAILRLVQNGEVLLDEDVIKYFPGFPYSGITVKDLLSHRSGLPNYLHFMDDKQKWPTAKRVSNTDVLNFLILHQPALNYKPGTRFNYSNTNYVLLALIIEKVTGTSYPQYLKETIFQPLGMSHTFVYTPSDSNHVVFSYKPSGAIWEQDIFDDTYGDKNIYSTPRDMLKWDAVLYSQKFIRPTLLDSAYTPLSNEKPSIHNYGLGWRMLNLANGKKVIYHNGKWHGFMPAFARLIDEKAVIIILSNQFNKNIYSAGKMAYNIFGDYLQPDTEAEEDVQQPLTEKATDVIPVKKQKTPTAPVNHPKKISIKQQAATKKTAVRTPVSNKKTTPKPIASPKKKTVTNKTQLPLRKK